MFVRHILIKLHPFQLTPKATLLQFCRERWWAVLDQQSIQTLVLILDNSRGCYSYIQNNKKMETTFALLLTMALVAIAAGQTTFKVTTSNKIINTLAEYTFSIAFGDTTTRSTLYLYLPSSLSLSTSSTATLNSVLLNSTQAVFYTGNSTVKLTASMSSNLTVILTSVMNPTSALGTYDFKIATNIAGDSVGPYIFNLIDYQSGALKSCLYSFGGTTQQTNSTLTVKIELGNPLQIGSNTVTVGYPISWANLASKSLTYGSPTISCSVSSAAGSYPASCTYDSTHIYVTVTLTARVEAGTNVTVSINNINSPPTITTPTSSSYAISTRDSQGYTVDSLSSCNISTTAISSLGGSFTNSALYINSLYSNPQINYTSTVPVTFQSGDTLQLSYPLSASSCGSTLYLNRNVPTSWSFTGEASSVRSYSYSSSSSNSQNGFILQIYLDCSMTTPPSGQPVTFSLLFSRNNNYYLNLTAEYSALPVQLINSSKYQITIENSAAVSGPFYYKFAVVLSQPLSKDGLVILSLPAGVNFRSFGNLSSCSAAINGSPSALLACNYTVSSSTSVSLYFNASSALAAGSTLALTLNNLYNPNYAFISFSFGLKTYYNSSLSSSLVEYASALTSKQYTTYTTSNVYISPQSFAVYESASVNFTYNSQVYLPAGSSISWTLPTEVSSTGFSNLAYVNGTVKQINESTVVSSSPAKVTIKYYYDLPIGSNFTIPITIKTPSNLGTYSGIVLSASVAGNVYEQSSLLKLVVNQTSPIYTTITPTSSYTGAQTTLSFQLTSFMPHSTPYFYLFITKPTQVTIVPTALSCQGNCLASVGYLNSSAINVTISNSGTTTNNYYTYQITVAGFMNPTHIGTSGLFVLQTYSSSGSRVASGSGSMQVALPSPITAVLSKERRYYRGNSDSVALYLTLSNVLTATDYILLTFSTDTYTNASSSVSCPLTEATCSISSQSTSNVLIVKAILDSNQLNTKSVTLTLSGLLSSSSTLYNQVRYFNVTSYNLNNLKIDQGACAYNVSCGQYSSYNCKTCSGDGSCASCYLDEGMNMLNSRCVSNCSSQTQYLSYTSSGVCLACGNNCYTCFNSTACRSCISNYYYYQNYSCLATCPTSSGYYITGGYCLRCYDTAYCLSCSSSNINGCTSCSGGLVLQQGTCVSSCTIANTYLSGDGMCMSCDSGCYGCTGAGNGACQVCNYGYFNSSGYCVSQCPTGSAAILSTQSCGCDSPCITCQDSSTYCLSCNTSSSGSPQFAYYGSCLSSCPSYSYLSGTQCLPCLSGCSNCTATSCYLCDSDRYIYNDKCYQDCNLISQQYDGDNSTGVKKCVLCPQGCDSCQGYTCNSCLSGYSLQNQTCLLLCIVLGNCESEVKRVLPVPGVVVVAAWVAVVVIAKLLLGKANVPYSILMVSSLIQIVQILVLLIVLSSAETSSSSTTISRLLVGMDYSYRIKIYSLLLASLVLSYVMNILFLYIFCRYIKPLLGLPKQIDLITNGIVLALATLTTYRLMLLSFSRMFPKPWIPIDNASRLTPVNYLCVVTLILDLLPFSAAIFLIYKQTTGTDLFMLGVDLLIVLSLNLIFTIYMVAVPKTENYFDQSVKKNNIQDNYKTEEDLNNEKNISITKLVTNQHIDRNDTFNDQLITHAIDNKTLLAMVGEGTRNQDYRQHSEEEDRRVGNLHHQYRTARKEGKERDQEGYGSFEEEEKDIEEVIRFQKKQDKNSSIAISEPIQSKKTKRNVRVSPKIKPKKQINLSPRQQLEQSHFTAKIQNQSDNLERKLKETAINFSKKLEPSKKHQGLVKHTESSGLKPMKSEIEELQEEGRERDPDAEMVLVKGRKEVNETPVNLARRHKGRKGQRQSEPKMMLKKQKVFLSGQGEDNSSNHVDLDTIIQSKIRESKRLPGKTQPIQTKNRDLAEDISPSWFNSQNQRIEVQELE